MDAAIRYGSGNWQGVVTEYIAGREFVLIASDGLAGGRRLRRPEALPDHTLLHHEEAANAWPQWAARHGVAQARVAAGPRFAQYSAIIQAARSGWASAWCRASWWRTNWLAVTCTACGASVVVDQGHYLCVRPDRLDLPAFGVFREWLLEQGALSRKPRDRRREPDHHARRSGPGPAGKQAGD